MCNFYAFRLEQQDEKFKLFTIPPMSSCSILGGALHISCFEEGMTVQARLCSGGDFDGIAKELSQKKAVKCCFTDSFLRLSTQVMLGPVVDIELVHPPDRTPPGVVFGIKHLLTVPNSPEVREALEDEANSHSHQIIKMTSEKDGKHELEVIDSTIELTSQYFITEKLEGKSLCKITSAWLPFFGSTHECTHSSLKDVVVTQKVGRCPHKKNSLYV